MPYPPPPPCPGCRPQGPRPAPRPHVRDDLAWMKEEEKACRLRSEELASRGDIVSLYILPTFACAAVYKSELTLDYFTWFFGRD